MQNRLVSTAVTGRLKVGFSHSLGILINKFLQVLRGFKNPLIDYAARHLCEELNKMKPLTLDKFRFPVYYEVA